MNTPVSPKIENSIIEALNDCFELYSNNVALVFNGEYVTFAVLNRRANKLAHLLIDRGVKPNDLIPVCLNQGIELIVAILGVLKSGGAYVPIDPDYPAAQINYIFKDCQPRLILTTTECQHLLQGTANASQILVDQLDGIDYSENNPNINIAGESRAYVMYTSGTTGNPNGVIIEHRSLVNNLMWAHRYFKLHESDVVLQKTTFCFDVSVWEILWPLLSGARLIIINKDDYRDSEKLKATIKLFRVTTIHFIPAMLEFFLLDCKTDEYREINTIICSGEALSTYQVVLLKNKLPNVNLYNLYGPTETTIHSTFWQVPDGFGTSDKVLIGSAIDNTSLYLLDEQGMQQAPGGIGELYIGGIGVARGYLNKPELTSSRFIVNSFNNEKPGRLFKTGDFGRQLPDGNIEYLGRIDDQVKIAGNRIELESIEAVLKTSGLAKHAVAAVKKTSAGSLNIIAFVVLNKGVSVADIWDYLLTKLPGYMLPASIKAVTQIPFTSNGKINKHLLVNPELPGDQGHQIIEPSNELENAIFVFWKSLFETEDISVLDNFFDLGGNSLLAVKLLSFLRRYTQRHINYITLHHYPTISSLADFLSKPGAVQKSNTLIPLKAGGNLPPLYLVNGGDQAGDGFFALAAALDPDQPVYGFESNGFNNKGHKFESIEEVATHYVNSILKDNPYGPYAVAGYSLGGVFAFEMARQLKALGKEVKLLAIIDSLTRDPALIKTQYSFYTVLRLMAFNIRMLGNGLKPALNYSKLVLKAALAKIKSRNGETVKSDADNSSSAELGGSSEPGPFELSVFDLSVSLYIKYVIDKYDGGLVVFKAKQKTFYMDDFKYLGWKPHAKKIKAISIDGHHLTLFDEPQVAAFGKRLQQELNAGF
ncbi:non-ribosomal peptide synthetase [Mucilaginibacter ginsenosidivorax]|uniref:Amino acid adenylation domain-containing protein n=1 Tax=Mucilaginibacter ginsenosidivorax TaxID=862126 RepID=A0A5B8W030_9SPHI|nr:amino acid adenylation domain-containing protein [Mucilaginibacter ginsenosidivorax]QEC77033.1 amino acid adenylation domain-containing protein [Mucilaginibacter ginsenosidivorax]